MPNTLVAVRACAGGHIVVDANVVGILKAEDGSVAVYCTDHAADFDRALRGQRRRRMLHHVEVVALGAVALPG